MGKVEIKDGRFVMWDDDDRKTFDSDEQLLYITDVFSGSFTVPYRENNTFEAMYGTQLWPVSPSTLRAGTTFAQGMVRLTTDYWPRDWMTVGGSLMPVYRAAKILTSATEGMQRQIFTLKIVDDELYLEEDYSIRSRTGSGGFVFNIPALTFEYVIAVGGFN